MNSKILCIVMVLSLGVMIIPSNNAFALNPKDVNWNDCLNGGCFSYAPQHPKISSVTNVMLDIFMPDGTCNVTGSIDLLGNCSAHSLIISNDNFTALKQNPVAMAVENIQQTTSLVNSNYCPIAYFTVTHEDGYFDKIQNVLSLVFPNYCYQELGSVKIPEFPQIAIIISAIAVLSAVIFTVKTGMKK